MDEPAKPEPAHVRLAKAKEKHEHHSFIAIATCLVPIACAALMPLAGAPPFLALILLVVAAGGFVGLMWLAYTEVDERAVDWEMAAERLGLSHTRTSINGSLAGHAIAVRYSSEREDTPARTILKVYDAPAFLTLKAHDRRTTLHRLFGRLEVRTGFEPFDQAIYLSGPEVETFSLFDEATRERVTMAVASDFAVDYGIVHLENDKMPEGIEVYILRAHSFAQCLAARAAIPLRERLHAIATGDPNVAVRERALVLAVTALPAPEYEATASAVLEKTSETLEDFLIRVLSSASTTDLRRAAIHALRTGVGTIRCVEALKHSAARDASVTTLARYAIAGIQTALVAQGAQPGQLEFVAPAPSSGLVSLSDGANALALAEKPKRPA